jgi:hypothetical protein
MSIRIILSALLPFTALAQTSPCDLSAYQASDGLKAAMREGALEVTWSGERGHELRAVFAVASGAPVIRDLAARKGSGEWVVLGSGLSPEYEITSGRRRISEQQMAPLRQLGVQLTPEVVNREKWNAFWDAPLMVPGAPNTNLDLPRRPEEVHRDWAKFRTTGCAVKTEGARLEISFPGVSAGVFSSGSLRYTVYRGANLLRQELIASTEEDSVAYKYVAGLKGFRPAENTRLIWRDVARGWQQYAFGGGVNSDPVAVKARNRLAILETGGGSLAVFPPSHKFFFARELETNLGFVYYRKDSENGFAIGVRQSDREEPYKPYGVSDAVWERRVRESRHDTFNFALYNAPPGTQQRMPAYFYLTAEDGRATQEAVMAFTHDDRYRELPGFQVLVSHFHMHFNEALTDAGTMDLQPSWLQVFRSLGINIVILADFHSDSHPNDPGPLRFKEQKVYFEGCRRFSDRGFLLVPGEEPNANFGGHYMMMLPRPVYWSHVKTGAQQFAEKAPEYGPVYHTGSPAEELDMLKREGGLIWQAHPRTKGSTGYPDAVRDQAHFLSDRFLGGSYQSMPVDQSESRICEKRCLGLLDEMNNWGAGPKYMLAEGDTYMKYPDDETFPQLIVNYVKLPKVPRFDEDWSPVTRALRGGHYFVSSGEVLLRDWSVEKGAYTAEVEWTFPLEFVEVIWGDGKTTNRRTVAATSFGPFGSHRFRVPFEAAGTKWVRFAAWDSAGNGALTQPVFFDK